MYRWWLVKKSVERKEITYPEKMACTQSGFMGHRFRTKFVGCCCCFLFNPFIMSLFKRQLCYCWHWRWMSLPFCFICKEPRNILHWIEVVALQRAVLSSWGHGLLFQYYRWVWGNDKVCNLLTQKFITGKVVCSFDDWLFQWFLNFNISNSYLGSLLNMELTRPNCQRFLYWKR